jgi:hypothetical protein
MQPFYHFMHRIEAITSTVSLPRIHVPVYAPGKAALASSTKVFYDDEHQNNNYVPLAFFTFSLCFVMCNEALAICPFPFLSVSSPFGLLAHATPSTPCKNPHRPS